MRRQRGLVHGLAERGVQSPADCLLPPRRVISPWALGYRGLGTLTAMLVILGVWSPRLRCLSRGRIGS
jgi:hypothetical protein